MTTSIKYGGFRFTKGDASNPTLCIVLPEGGLNTSHALHVCEATDADTDWNVSADTHPSVYIHSATTPATYYMKLYHDGTYGYLNIAGTTVLTATTSALATALPLSITNATASTTTTSGALIVTGGVGVAKGLFVGEVVSVGTVCQPDASDGAALGTTSLMWSDLFLASGGVINFNAGDVTLTHSSNDLAIAGGTLTVGGGLIVSTVTTGATFNGTYTTAMDFSGTFTQGINFDDATLNIASAMGRNRCFIGVGTYGDHLSLNLSAADQSGDRCYLTQLFVDSTANPGHTNMYLQGAYYRINVTTATQANLSVGGMCPTLDIDYNVKNAYALKAELDMSATGLTIGQNAFAVSGYLEVAASGNLDVSGCSGAAAVTADFAGGTGLTLTGTSRTFALKGNVYSGATATGVICCRVDGSGIVTDGISIECGATATMTNALAFNAMGGMTYLMSFESIAGFLSTASDSTDVSYEVAVNVEGVGAKYLHLFDT